MTRTSALLLVMLGLVAGGDAPEAEYEAKLAALAADNADGHYRLALWCEEKGLAALALREHRTVLVIDEDHRASRRALGYERVCDRWLKGKEAMAAKGFKEHEGRWVTPEEYQLFAKDEIAAGKAREARQAGDAALRMAWNADPGMRSRAMTTIEGLDAAHRLRPLAIAARIAHSDVRMRAVEGLKALNSAEALPPLYKRAIFDADEAIRGAAVDAIRATDAEGKIGPFVQALNSAFAPVRINAVKALGDLGDPAGIGPLVARYQVTGGSGQSVYISQTNQISFVQDFDVEVAQTAFIADPVIGVIQDGLTLNFRALATSGTIDIYERRTLAGSLSKLSGKDLGDDPKAWAAWWKKEQELRASKARNS